jgi:hypothetical protein
VPYGLMARSMLGTAQGERGQNRRQPVGSGALDRIV